jgi:hypothetical protein
MNLMKSFFGSNSEEKEVKLQELIEKIDQLEKQLAKVTSKLEKIAGPIDG